MKDFFKEILVYNFEMNNKLMTLFENHPNEISEKAQLLFSHLLIAQYLWNNRILKQDSAYKVEPEVGLDFDPIVDGQDFPDKGFKIKSIDKATGLVTLQGIDWQDFEVVLKVVNENDKSLVNGSGIINIPMNKQPKR